MAIHGIRTLAGWSRFSGAVALAAISCSSEAPDDAGVAAVELPLMVSDVDFPRCEAGRFESTAAQACHLAETPSPFLAGAFGSASPPRVLANFAYGVRLPSIGAGVFEGEVELVPAFDGEYLAYLGTPNVEVDVLGSGAVPVCARYLPNDPPATYPAGCDVRGAYALNLRAGEPVRFRFGPSPTSYVRLAIVTRRAAGVSAGDGVICSDDRFRSTLSMACALAASSTPISASTFGGSSPAIAAGTTYGVRLRAIGDFNEASLSFTPPYTADFVAYTGTPGAKPAMLSAALGQQPSACSSRIDTDTAQRIAGVGCSPLRGGWFFRRLTGGETYDLELGPLSPQSWVRTLLLPTAPDSDGDGLADNLDRCPTEPGDPTCGCAPAVCLGGALWTREIDSGGLADRAGAVATDASGNIYVAGSVEAFETVTVFAVRKFDPAGNPLWVRTLEYSDSSDSTGIAIDGNGNVIVGGAYYDNGEGHMDHLVAKLDSSGNLLWASREHTVDWGEAGGVAVNAANEIAFVGGTVEGRSRPLVRKFDAVGNVLWVHLFDDLTGSLHGAAFTSDGSLYVAGRASVPDRNRAFVAKLDSGGNELWRSLRGTDAALAWDVATDSAGNALVASQRTVPGSGLVEKLGPSGDTLFSELLPGVPRAVAVDASDAIALTGSGLWAAKYDSGGAALWTIATSPEPVSVGVDVAFDASGRIVVVGTGSYPADQGGQNIVLAQYAP